MSRSKRVRTIVDKTATFPEWITPMAATLTSDRFTGEEWTFERKIDGIRLIAYKSESDVKLFSRNRLPQHLPAIADSIARLPAKELILDGELTWNTAAYHVFDIMWFNGRDVMPLPLIQRRDILAKLPLEKPLLRVAPLHHHAPWEKACAEGWEGVIAKRLDAPYEQRRSKLWLKMKCEIQHDFVVGGFTDPLGARVGLGALLVGYYSGDDFVFAGKVGTGFDTKLLTTLRSKLDATIMNDSPFTKGTGLPRLRQHWVRPRIVIRVAFIEWTRFDKLRHSRLLGIVTDRDPRSVVREE